MLRDETSEATHQPRCCANAKHADSPFPKNEAKAANAVSSSVPIDEPTDNPAVSISP